MILIIWKNTVLVGSKYGTVFSVVVYYGGSESQIFFTSYNYKYDCACSIVVKELDNKKKLVSFEIGLKALKVLF